MNDKKEWESLKNVVHPVDERQKRVREHEKRRSSGR
jgi:hypothetical protein